MVGDGWVARVGLLCRATELPRVFLLQKKGQINSTGAWLHIRGLLGKYHRVFFRIKNVRNGLYKRIEPRLQQPMASGGPEKAMDRVLKRVETTWEQHDTFLVNTGGADGDPEWLLRKFFTLGVTGKRGLAHAAGGMGDGAKAASVMY